jgi:hypothetical protein
MSRAAQASLLSLPTLAGGSRVPAHSLCGRAVLPPPADAGEGLGWRERGTQRDCFSCPRRTVGCTHMVRPSGTALSQLNRGRGLSGAILAAATCLSRTLAMRSRRHTHLVLLSGAAPPTR